MCILKDCQYTVYLYYEIKDSKYPGYLCIKTDNILDIHYMAFKTKTANILEGHILCDSIYTGYLCTKTANILKMHVCNLRPHIYWISMYKKTNKLYLKCMFCYLRQTFCTSSIYYEDFALTSS